MKLFYNYFKQFTATLLVIVALFQSNNTFGQTTPILVLNDNSMNQEYGVTAENVVFNGIQLPECEGARLYYVGVNVDASSQAGSLLLGLYENNALIYQTGFVAVQGGVDEMVGESIPLGITMSQGNDYHVAVSHGSPNMMYFKGTDAPVYSGSSSFQSNQTHIDATVNFPILPLQTTVSSTETMNIAFHLEGTTASLNTASTIIETACDEYTSPSGNFTWTTSGVYQDVITNANGCDSVITIDLTIGQSFLNSETEVACESFTWPVNGQTYTVSGMYIAYYVASNGCDSTYQLDLTINSVSSSVTEEVTCYNFLWAENGQTYTSSGIYVAMYTNAGGCDSSVILDLTITQPTIDTVSVMACESYFWDFSGQTYDASGVYEHTILSSQECDSTMILRLDIENGVVTNETATACDAYTWPLNGMTYTTSGIYTRNLVNTMGCDTIVQLDLTINDSKNTTDAIVTCEPSYTWIDGVTYTSANNTATMTYSTVNGCDSTVTLDLLFSNGNDAVETIVACDSYTWVNGVTYTESTNTPSVTNVTSNGCDYTTTLDLTILESTSSDYSVSACGAFTWIDGNTYLNTNNTASYVIPNAAGCDSVITLNLTITEIDPTVSASGLTLSSNDANATYQWYLQANGLQAISGATEQTLTVADNGTYVVEVTEGTCSDMSAAVVVNSASVNELESASVVLYPNPSNGQFKIRMNEELDNIQLFDMTGRKLDIQFDLSTKSINANGLNAGKYFVQIETTSQKVVMKEMVIL